MMWLFGAEPRLRVRLRAKPGDSVHVNEVLDTDHPQRRRFARKLLGSLLYQAFRDGMSGLKLCRIPESDELRMWYVQHNKEGATSSYEMSPPLGRHFPVLLQAVFGLTEFDGTCALRGTLLADLNGRRLQVRVELHGFGEITLLWEQPETGVTQSSDGPAT